MILTIYHYNESGEVTATGTIDTSIFKELPPMSTTKPMPETKENEIALFDLEKREWMVHPDYRGKRYIDEEGNIITIEEIGQVPEESWEEYIFEAEEETNWIEQRIIDLENAIAELRGGANVE